MSWAVALAGYAVYLAVGLACMRGAWLCHFRPERSGDWETGRTFAALLTVLLLAFAGFGTFLASVQPAAGEAANEFFLAKLKFGAAVVGATMLYLPLATFHLGRIVSALLAPGGEGKDVDAAGAPQPTDIEDRLRSDLRRNPSDVSLRLALAEAAAEAGRVHQAREILAQGLATDGLAPEARRLIEEAIENIDRVGTELTAEGLGVPRGFSRHFDAAPEVEPARDDRPVPMDDDDEEPPVG